MATVPGVLLFGDYAVQGGQSPVNATYVPVSGIPVSPIWALNDRDLMNIVPCVAATGEPNASSLSFYPWYDGNADEYANFFLVTGAGGTGSLQTSVTVTIGGVSPGWTTNEWVGRTATFNNLTSGGGGTSLVAGVTFWRRAVITANTADTLTFASGTAVLNGSVGFVGRGRFTDYHPAGGHLTTGEIGGGLVSRRGGSGWQAHGIGTGPDASLVRRLYEDVYPDSPYFHLVKFATTGTIITSWADPPNNASRSSFTAELTRINAAATAVGNTISWQHAVIDMQTVDTIYCIANPAQILNYEARLTEFIAWLRSASALNNANLTIHFVQNSTDLYTVTGAGAIAFLRAAVRSIAREDGNIRLLDMQGATLGKTSSTAIDPPASEAKDYALHEYLRLGNMMSASIAAANATVGSAPSNGLPTYLLIGDSICAGPATTTWVTNSNSTRISGPNPPSLLRPSNQKVWNNGGLALEVYEPGVNSNTIGTVNTSSGPELSLTAQLGDLHPDGFALIKYGSNGSTLAANSTPYSGGAYGSWLPSEAEHYPVLLQAIANCFSYINEVVGKQVDFRGCGVILGTNDQAQSGGGDAFEAALSIFCEALWDDVTTRTSGDRFPVVWCLPQTDASTAIEAESILVRRALNRYALQEGQFRVVDCDDLERDRTDDLHDTPDSAVERGDRMFAALQRVALT